MRSCLTLLALILAAGAAQAQQVPTLTGPAGVYSVTAPAPVTIEHGDGYVLIRWASVPTPGPTPTPTPGPTPTPTPTPVDPAPIPDAGLRVLIVYETAELTKIPRDQLAILYDQTFRDWLSGLVVKGPDTRTPEWRVYDKDAVVTEPVWQAALARPRKQVPWLVVSNGKTGWEGPLPATVADTRAIIQRYVNP